MKRIYLDHAATTALRRDALEAMLPWLQDTVAANPSSVHRSGQRARAAVETAREQIARAVGAAPGEIVFTSGATEADALALLGARTGSAQTWIVNAAEHAAIREVALQEKTQGREVIWLNPGPAGAPTVNDLRDAFSSATSPVGLVAVMHTNNETGVKADVPGLADIAHDQGAVFVCDAVQAFGYEPLNVRELNADFVSLSAHKMEGPQGVGALWIRDGVQLEARQLGGGQERGKRAGTHAVAPIVGFGAAVAAIGPDVAEVGNRIGKLRDHLQTLLTAIPGVMRNGSGPRGPKHLNVRVEDVDGEALLFALDAAGLDVSAGSACSAGSIEASHVLLAMGLTKEAARASVRFSLGRSTTREEIEEAGQRFADVVRRLRS